MTSAIRWAGRTNPNVPTLPSGKTSDALFADQHWRQQYWFPDPLTLATPELSRFWTSMMSGVTEFRPMTPINPPPEDLGLTTSGLRRLGRARKTQVQGRSRRSRSPNWSGASIRATASSTYSHVVGSWIEPTVQPAGPHQTQDYFRSSIWIGLNGHASHIDAAMPQIGTMQRIPHSPIDGKSHWTWFEWWVNVESNSPVRLYLPVYFDLDVEPGDRVYASVELIPGPAVSDPPVVARMCMCVEHPAVGTSAPTRKVVLMPFLVFPPELDEGQVTPEGAAASWVAELPTSLNPRRPFLMPRFESPLRFSHCTAACASTVQGPAFAEQNLELASLINLIGVRHEPLIPVAPDDETEGIVDLLAEVADGRPDPHQFELTVFGNGGA